MDLARSHMAHICEQTSRKRPGRISAHNESAITPQHDEFPFLFFIQISYKKSRHSQQISLPSALTRHFDTSVSDCKPLNQAIFRPECGILVPVRHSGKDQTNLGFWSDWLFSCRFELTGNCWPIEHEKSKDWRDWSFVFRRSRRPCLLDL